MKSRKLGKIGIAVTVAVAGSLFVVAAPAVAGTLLGGATVTNPARGTMDGSVIDGPVKLIMPRPRNGEQFDIVAAYVNIPPGGGIDWHTHPGPTFGIVTGGGALTILNDECVAKVHETGDAFVEGTAIHTARNYSNAPVTVRVTFFLPHTSPPTPPTVFLTPADDDVMDAYCGLVD